MTRIFQHPWGWASLPPLLCTAHCLVTPVAVAVAPTLAPGTTAEWGLLGLTLLLGGAAVASGIRTHGVLLPAALITAGLLAWSGSLLHLYHPLPEEATTIAASLTVAGALIWNSRLHCAARTVPCSACAWSEGEAATPARRHGTAVEPGRP